MKCKIFRDKLQEYIDRSLSSDMNKAMNNHLMECADCKKLYDEELEIEKLFKSALETDNINFNSSRQQVIKSIDKNLYGKSVIKKLKFTVIRNRAQVIAAGLILAVAATGTYAVFNIKSSNRYATNSKSEYKVSNKGSKLQSRYKTMQKETITTTDTKQKNTYTKVSLDNSIYDDQSQYAKLNLTDNAYVAMFRKGTVKKDTSDGTRWEKSPNGVLQFSLRGKGENGHEEGEGYLLFKNRENKMWKIYIADNKKQYSPLSVEWFDNSNVLATVGLGYGTVVVGGDLYMINVNDGKAVNVYNLYTSTNGKKQIARISKEDNTLKLKLREYTDDALDNHKEESIKLYFNESGADTTIKAKPQDAWQKSLDKLAEYVDDDNFNNISELFDTGADESGKQKILNDMSKAKKVTINKYIDVTPSVNLENLKDTYPYIRQYIVDMTADMESDGEIIKNGRNYLCVTLVSKDSSSIPLIYNIGGLSHN